MIRWGITWCLACAAIFALLRTQRAMIGAQATAIAWCADSLELEQDLTSVCLSTLSECKGESLNMTHEEALVAMTKLWLEAETKLKNSVSLDELEELREKLVALAPAALQSTVDEFFEKVKHR